MATKRTPLTKAFLEDHQKMTRGIARLRNAIQRNDLATAARLADELDRVAGPHIEFEEKAYYPLLVEALGEDFVERLYQEHEEGLKAVRALLRRKSDGKTLSPDQRNRLLGQIHTALEHAGTCGTLVSHLAVLDEDRQAALLEQIEEARRRQRRWTEVGE